MKNENCKVLADWDVIIIEDQVDNLEIASTILTFYGANVHIAYNGKEGLDLLRTVKPRFILCDLSMPVMDGWEFIDVVKKDRELSEIPVIALTAHSFSEFRTRAIMSGFHNFMTKPFTIQSFTRDLLKLLPDVPELNSIKSNASHELSY